MTPLCAQELGTDYNFDKARTGTVRTARSNSKRDAFAFYLKDTFSVSDKWIWEAGYRYDYSRYDEHLTWPAFDGLLEFEGHSPRIGFKYNFDNGTSGFINYARAFKTPAIFDIDAVTNNARDNSEIDPQVSDNYEIGLKGVLFDKINYTTSLFYIYIKFL